MSKRNIHIENVKIRLPQSARGSERVIAGQIGREILMGIAETTRSRTGKKQVGELSTTVTGETGGQGLSKQIGRAVSQELAKRFE